MAKVEMKMTSSGWSIMYVLQVIYLYGILFKWLYLESKVDNAMLG